MKNQTLHFFVAKTSSPFLFDQFSLTIEHRKFEVFHFSKLTRFFNPSPLDLSY